MFDLIAWAQKNQQQLIAGAVAVLVVASAFSLYVWNKNRTERDACHKLLALPSMVRFTTAVAPPNTQDFVQLHESYSGTTAGEHALLLAGTVAYDQGNAAEAQKQYERFLSQYPDSPAAPQAALGVAASLEAAGKNAEAIKSFQDVLNRYATDTVASPAKLALARLKEVQNTPQDRKEAAKLYRELNRSTNPYDPWSNEANERLQQLLSQFPDLAEASIPVATDAAAVTLGGEAAPSAPPAAPPAAQ